MTCSAGYSKSSITQRCIKDCPAGYTNTGETCFRTVSTLGMGSMLCNADERREGARCYPASGSCGSGGESDAGLCYPKCKAGFGGVGPVCWQKCDPNWTECAAGCAKTKLECGLVVAEQVYSPLVVAANIVTMGSASKVTMVAQGAEDVMKIQKTITIGGKTFTSGTKLGKAFIKVLDVVQTIKPASVVKGTSVIKRVYIAKTGTKTAKVLTTGKVLKSTYTVSNDFYDAYSEDFETQTSAEINREIDNRFHPMTAQFLKREWGKIQLSEMAGTNGFNIAQDVLAVVSIVDITGVTGVVSAYTKPICQDVISFPTFSQSYK